MACWCDGPTMVDKECPCGARWRAPEHWQHCPYCGYDLRLPVSPTWPFVSAFSAEMEKKLAENRHKGDREGWLKHSPRDLLDRLLDEVFELRDEVRNGHSSEAVLGEAADVANFAM